MIPDTLANGGGTYVPGTLTRVNLTDGYLVATRTDSRIVPLDDFTPETVGLWLYHVSVALRPYGGCPRYIGTWVHDGRVYLDVVEHVSDYWHAAILGRDRNQIAVWDCRNECEIPTNGTGEA